MFTSDTGFLISRNSDSVLVPDLAFVSNEQLPNQAAAPVGYLPFSPALAVEIVSPTNREAELHRKIGLYLTAGSRLV